MVEKLYKMNLVVIGDDQVGKTSFIKVYKEKTFAGNSKATIGLNYVTTTYRA